MAIMKTRRGNQLLISGKQKLEITDTGIRTESLFCNRQITAFTPYKIIDQIYLIYTKSSSDLVITSTEQGTIRLKALKKDEAKKVKDHIELILINQKIPVFRVLSGSQECLSIGYFNYPNP